MTKTLADVLLSVVTLQMVCWRARIALLLLLMGGVLDMLRYAR